VTGDFVALSVVTRIWIRVEPWSNSQAFSGLTRVRLDRTPAINRPSDWPESAGDTTGGVTGRSRLFIARDELSSPGARRPRSAVIRLVQTSIRPRLSVEAIEPLEYTHRSPARCLRASRFLGAPGPHTEGGIRTGWGCTEEPVRPKVGVLCLEPAHGPDPGKKYRPIGRAIERQARSLFAIERAALVIAVDRVESGIPIRWKMVSAGGIQQDLVNRRPARCFCAFFSGVRVEQSPLAGRPALGCGAHCPSVRAPLRRWRVSEQSTACENAYSFREKSSTTLNILHHGSRPKLESLPIHTSECLRCPARRVARPRSACRPRPAYSKTSAASFERRAPMRLAIISSTAAVPAAVNRYKSAAALSSSPEAGR